MSVGSATSMSRLKHCFAKRSRPLALGLGLGLTLIVAISDFVTGAEIRFGFFYLLPVAIAAWTGDKFTGIMLSLVCAMTSRWVDLLGGIRFSHPLIPVWNGLMTAAAFVTVALLIDALRNEQARLEQAVRQRTAALTAEIEERKRTEKQLRDANKELSARENDLLLATTKLGKATSRAKRYEVLVAHSFSVHDESDSTKNAI